MKERVISAFELGRRFGDQHDWAKRVGPAWQQLLARLAAHERGDPVAPSGFDEILCAARAVGPSRFLKVKVFESSPRAWSMALREGLRARGSVPTLSEVPFGIVGHALLRLGFGRLDLSWVELFCESLQTLAKASQEERATLKSTLFESGAWKREAAPAGSVVVVCKPTGSLTEAWTEAPTKAFFFVLTQDEFKSEASQEPSMLTLLPSPVHLLWERVEGKEHPDPDLVAAASKLKQSFRPPLDLLASPWTRSQALLTPRGADELVSLLRAPT